MEKTIPGSLLNPFNTAVLGYIADGSAHSDVAEALLQAVRPLAGVQSYCPDPARYRYVAVFTETIIFAFAIGMKTVAFRLDARSHQHALQVGAMPIPELKDEWLRFDLFQGDRPDTDLLFWARKAYLRAKQLLVA